MMFLRGGRPQPHPMFRRCYEWHKKAAVDGLGPYRWFIVSAVICSGVKFTRQ